MCLPPELQWQVLMQLPMEALWQLESVMCRRPQHVHPALIMAMGRVRKSQLHRVRCLWYYIPRIMVPDTTHFLYNADFWRLASYLQIFPVDDMDRQCEPILTPWCRQTSKRRKVAANLVQQLCTQKQSTMCFNAYTQLYTPQMELLAED
jgi:hypothetical protein